VSQFDKLVNLREFELDERRRESGDLLGEVNRLIAQQERLEEKLKKEQQIASQSLEARFAYGEFANNVIRQRGWLSAALRVKEKEYESAKERVLLAYQEKRKAEIVREEAIEKENQKKRLVEQAEIDEIAQNIHRRKTKNSLD